jgi:hypothetical protein
MMDHKVKQLKLFAPNLICIGVDSFRDNDFVGRIWQPYADDPQEFVGMNDLLIRMDNLYDIWNYPQNALNVRSFFRTQCVEPVRDIRTGEFKDKIDRLQSMRGDEATFIVQVVYRQRATWQGQFVWVEGNEREHFKSAWEFIQLMDEKVNGRE